jgi:hypothetical protein
LYSLEEDDDELLLLRYVLLLLVGAEEPDTRSLLPLALTLVALPLEFLSVTAPFDARRGCCERLETEERTFALRLTLFVLSPELFELTRFVGLAVFWFTAGLLLPLTVPFSLFRLLLVETLLTLREPPFTGISLCTLCDGFHEP